MADTLPSCPFCGSANVMKIQAAGRPDMAHCNGCGAGELVEIWSKRPAGDAARIEQLQAELLKRSQDAERWAGLAGMVAGRFSRAISWLRNSAHSYPNPDGRAALVEAHNALLAIKTGRADGDEPVVVEDDMIARSKRILSLVDLYVEDPNKDTRAALRHALCWEFERELNGHQLLEIARKTGLREHMHGVPPSVARELLAAFVAALPAALGHGPTELPPPGTERRKELQHAQLPLDAEVALEHAAVALHKAGDTEAHQHVVKVIGDHLPGQGKPLAHGHRDDYFLLANGRRLAETPIAEAKRMPNWVLASVLFATGSTSANQICVDAGIDPDGFTVPRK